MNRILTVRISMVSQKLRSCQANAELMVDLFYEGVGLSVMKNLTGLQTARKNRIKTNRIPQR